MHTLVLVYCVVAVRVRGSQGNTQWMILFLGDAIESSRSPPNVGVSLSIQQRVLARLALKKNGCIEPRKQDQQKVDLAVPCHCVWTYS